MTTSPPCAMHCSPSQLAKLCCVYGEAYSRGMWVRGRQCRDDRAEALHLSELPPADSHPSALSLAVHDNMSQNRMYITYYTVVRGGLSHGRKQHVQKMLRGLDMWFLRYASRQINRQDTWLQYLHTHQSHTCTFFAWLSECHYTQFRLSVYPL